MSLIVEDGSNVAGANSYNSVSELKAYAKLRGVDLSSFDNATISGWAIDAMDWIESYRNQFKGIKTYEDQSLQWPRKSDPLWGSLFIQIDGINVPSDSLPKELKSLHAQLVIERSKGTVLFPTSVPDSRVKLQKVGPITTEYQLDGTTPTMPAVDALLSVLIENSGFGLTVIRV